MQEARSETLRNDDNDEDIDDDDDEGRSFARRTFTTPKKPYICQEDNCHPQFFFFFFWRIFFGFFDLQLMEDIKDGKEEVLDEVVNDHWSWSTSSKGA